MQVEEDEAPRPTIERTTTNDVMEQFAATSIAAAESDMASSDTAGDVSS